MKNIFYYLIGFLGAILITFFACEKSSIEMDELQTSQEEELSSKIHNPSSANGQGTIALEDGNKRHFTFHANTMPDGSVYGNGVLTYTAGVMKIKFSIDCMVINVNTARISGIITNSTHPEISIGNSFCFEVIDNGEGKNSTPDQMSIFYYENPENCNTNNYVVPSDEIHEIEGGNIQVK